MTLDVTRVQFLNTASINAVLSYLDANTEPYCGAPPVEIGRRIFWILLSLFQRQQFLRNRSHYYFPYLNPVRLGL